MEQILPAKVLPVSYSSLRVLAIMAHQGLHQFSHMDHLLESAVAKHSTQVSVKQLHITFSSWQCMRQESSLHREMALDTSSPETQENCNFICIQVCSLSTEAHKLELGPDRTYYSVTAQIIASQVHRNIWVRRKLEYHPVADPLK